MLKILSWEASLYAVKTIVFNGRVVTFQPSFPHFFIISDFQFICCINMKNLVSLIVHRFPLLIFCGFHQYIMHVPGRARSCGLDHTSASVARKTSPSIISHTAVFYDLWLTHWWIHVVTCAHWWMHACVATCAHTRISNVVVRMLEHFNWTPCLYTCPNVPVLPVLRKCWSEHQSKTIFQAFHSVCCILSHHQVHLLPGGVDCVCLRAVL